MKKISLKKTVSRSMTTAMSAAMAMMILVTSVFPAYAGEAGDEPAPNVEASSEAETDTVPEKSEPAATGIMSVPDVQVNTDTVYEPDAGTEAAAQESGAAGDSEVQGEVIVDENNDDIEIRESDRPYLALGADLTDQQRAAVLSIMGIDPVNLGNYDVVYVTNEEEHQYLGSYIDASQIGSRSLSSVLIVEREKGNGLNISTNNITYCTVGMYKNALMTAGVTDADIIVAGPTGISGTAALVGIFKAYQEMTGEEIRDDVVDAALNELVITGLLEDSIDGLTDGEVEEFIAYIKGVIAENDLDDEDSINQAIDDACEKYGVTLSDSERQQIVDLLLKITSLGIDLSGLVDYAQSLYHSYRDGNADGILASIGSFFTNIFSAIADFFKGLFS